MITFPSFFTSAFPYSVLLKANQPSQPNHVESIRGSPRQPTTSSPTSTNAKMLISFAGSMDCTRTQGQIITLGSKINRYILR